MYGCEMNADRSKTTTKILAILLVLAMVMVARESAQFVSTLEEHARRTFQKNGEEITIVIDAGHGGVDPGKIGVNNTLEKDINLAIALKLERNLKENGIHVVMTRTDDNGLYKENDTNSLRISIFHIKDCNYKPVCLSETQYSTITIGTDVRE